MGSYPQILCITPGLPGVFYCAYRGKSVALKKQALVTRNPSQQNRHSAPLGSPGYAPRTGTGASR